jgi:hypothetical protein
MDKGSVDASHLHIFCGLFVYSLGGLGEDRLRRDSRLRSSRCTGLLSLNLVSSFKCSSF